MKVIIKSAFFIVFILNLNLTFAQQIEISYEHKKLLQPKNLPVHDVHKLININNSYSVYSFDKKLRSNAHAMAITTDGSEDLLAYKNFEKDSIITVYPIVTAYRYIAESIPRINWQLTEEYKEILGYNARKATANYRGRDYIAFFTDKLPVSDGPWKFNGLPGLILEIYDSENKVSYEAISIKISEKANHKFDLNTKIEGKRLYTFDEYIRMVKKSQDRIKTAIRSALSNSSGAGVSEYTEAAKYHQEVEIVDFEKY